MLETNKIKTYPTKSDEYENFNNYHKIYLKTRVKQKMLCAKYIEYLITFIVATLFIVSICYFFVKLYSFSKIEKHLPSQETIEQDGITFEL